MCGTISQRRNYSKKVFKKARIHKADSLLANVIIIISYALKFLVKK